MINRPSYLICRVLVLTISICSLISTAKTYPISSACTQDNGTWGNWTDWTPCTRSCGSGVSTRTRECLNGQCTGEIVQYKSCCIEQCLSKMADANFREMQCKQRDYSDGQEGTFEWVPALEGNDGCRLHCVNKTSRSSIVHSLTTYVQDGTACVRANTGERGVCLGSLCAAIGCDGVLGSGKNEDKCLRCLSSDENDSLCHRTYVNATYSSDTVDGNIVVLNLPIGTMSIKITQPLKSQGTLTLRLSGKSYHAFTGHTTSKFIVEDTMFDYKVVHTNGKDYEVLYAKGPVSAPVIVELINVTSTLSPNIEYEYHTLSESGMTYENAFHSEHEILEVTDQETDSFVWEYGCFGLCSVSCGVGVQVSQAICKDLQYPSRELSDAHCINRGLDKPFPTERVCNSGKCPARWIVGEWSGCPTDCTQVETYEHRPVGCYRFVADGGNSSPVPDFECSDQPKPAIKRPCVAIECTSFWRAGDWSECTHPCNGIQERAVNCVETTTENLLDDMHCTFINKPATTQSCGENCNSLCRWAPTNWGKCSALYGCGPGSQKRRLRCRYISNNNRANDSCCEGLLKPDMEQECYTNRGTKCTTAWYKKVYGECKGDCCGDQYVQREVTCNAVVDGDLIKFPNKFCTEPKPSTNTTCQRHDCPQWETSAFGECSTTCGDGERMRQVTCMSNGEQVEERLCRCQERKPTGVRVCENSSCPTITETPCMDIITSCESILGECTDPVFKYACCSHCRERGFTTSS